MVDYEYYVNCYLGSRIPQREFSGYARRAAAYLERLCRIYRVEGGQDARAMAQCAMAEELHRRASRQGMLSTSIGGVQVRYQQDSQGSLLAQMYRSAGIYLDIYRGKELCKTNGVSAV